MTTAKTLISPVKNAYTLEQPAFNDRRANYVTFVEGGYKYMSVNYTTIFIDK